MNDVFNPEGKLIFILEMANNHMGQLSHGLKIIDEMRAACSGFDFTIAVKFQYRSPSFIHPQYRQRMDLPYVKRFTETRLSPDDYGKLLARVRELDWKAACTPFDEPSVDLVEEHRFDFLKVASCSFTDWPLLERIGQSPLPVIASTAGATLQEIDRVVLFFEHRQRPLALMHCVGEYPTPPDHLELNQIDLLRQRYPMVPIGFSTHEEPDNVDAVKIAIAKGATILEKHVGLRTDEIGLNAYSATPEQVAAWLGAARDAARLCGVADRRKSFSDKEQQDLRQFKRGVFARTPVAKGDSIGVGRTFFAFPNQHGQLVANDMSRYVQYVAREPIEEGQPVLHANVEASNDREKVVAIVNRLRHLLIESKIHLPDRLDLELSHHYGIDRFDEWGGALINIINREYCKKLILLLPGQKHPSHMHRQKEETFHVLHGDMTLDLGGVEKHYTAGDLVTVERGVHHHFSTQNGVVVEEISTTSYKDDSYYADEQISRNRERKTYMTFWSDWLDRPVV